MTLATLELASLLCSRLCHDLLSPVGALSNGLELLADEKDPDMRQRCFELLEQSAKTSADKLRFFRLAFGAGGGFGEAVAMHEPRAVIDALVGNKGRIAVTWALASETMPKPAVKVLLNLALIGIEALVRGGTLDIVGETRDTPQGRISEIVIRAAGTRIAFDPTVGQALDGTLATSALSAKTAPAYMIEQLVTGFGGGLQTQVSAEQLVMGAVLPAA
jgi:histidine phosphotransferase ChpT